jgi:hypothetical protein
LAEEQTNQNPKPQGNDMRKFINKMVGLLGLVLATQLGLTGCISRMALDANKGSLAKLSKPIGIFTLRTENALKPAYEPEVTLIKVVSRSSQDTKTFGRTEPYKRVENEYLEYLVSVDLAPGDYSLGNVHGIGQGFLITGNFKCPVNTRFNLTSGVTYLGHITMINRKHKEGEERSGSVFPLIDQAACGFYAGTFDVTVTDRSETDIPDFMQAYPPLKDIPITKAIMQK